jgi:hypothetical protein
MVCKHERLVSHFKPLKVFSMMVYMDFKAWSWNLNHEGNLCEDIDI